MRTRTLKQVKPWEDVLSVSCYRDLCSEVEELETLLETKSFANQETFDVVDFLLTWPRKSRKVQVEVTK